jgi:hypothetical protein
MPSSTSILFPRSPTGTQLLSYSFSRTTSTCGPRSTMARPRLMQWLLLRDLMRKISQRILRSRPSSPHLNMRGPYRSLLSRRKRRGVLNCYTIMTDFHSMESSFVGLVYYDPPQIRNPAWLKERLLAGAVLQQLFLPWLQALILLASLRSHGRPRITLRCRR